MKVLHVIPSVGRLRGGPSFAMRRIAAALAAGGLSVEVATTNDNGPERLHVPLGTPVEEGGVVWRYFPLDAYFYNTSFALARWLMSSVADYDVVHIHAVFSFCSTAAAFACRRRRVPYVVRPLGVLNRWGMQNRRPWLKSLSFRWIDRRILEGAALVQYTSEQERDEAALLGVNCPSTIIPNPVDASPGGAVRGAFRARYPELAENKIILFLSRIDPKKGLDLLLPAFVEVRRRHREAVLLIGGSGPADYLMEMQRTAAELGIATGVRWLGFLGGEEKDQVLADADVFVLPSYSENFGISVVEAMAAGLPVVITDQVGVHGEIAAAAAGIVTTCEVNSIAGALGRLLSSDEERTRTGANAKQLAGRCYSSSAVAGGLREVYSRLAWERKCAVPSAPRTAPHPTSEPRSKL